MGCGLWGAALGAPAPLGLGLRSRWSLVMAALGLLGPPLRPHLPALIQFPPWWLLHHGFGPARPWMLLTPLQHWGVLPSRSLCLGEIKTRRGKASCQTSRFTQHLPPKCPAVPAPRAAGCSLHAPHFIIFLAQAAHPTPGWDFFLHPLAEPGPHADPCWKQQQWEVLVLSFLQPWLCCPAACAVLLLWCPIQAISPHLFHSICSSVLSPEISAPADVLCTLKNI